jgi:hypothetical protein
MNQEHATQAEKMQARIYMNIAQNEPDTGIIDCKWPIGMCKSRRLRTLCFQIMRCRMITNYIQDFLY